MILHTLIIKTVRFVERSDLKYMKYTIVHRYDHLSLETKEKIIKGLANFPNISEDEKNPDIVITIGGDGTLLEAFHYYQEKLSSISFLGIHTGHLGFYTDWHPEEVEELIHNIVTQPLKVVEYPLIEIVIERIGNTDKFLALNELTVKSVEKTMVMQIYINEQPFEVFRGDGLCIATPSGSTGYNKSLNGALIHPSLESIQISEMASLNNRVYRTIGSPLILPKHHVLTLNPQHPEREYHFTIDHLHFSYHHIKKINLRVASEKIRFVRYREFPFWMRVRDSFIGRHHFE